MGAAKVAVAFLHADGEPVGFSPVFKPGDTLAYIFKACEQVVNFGIETLADFSDKLRGDNGLNDNGFFGESALPFLARQHIVGKKAADIVARKQHILTVLENSQTHSVAVGVGGYDEVCLVIIGQLKGFLKSLSDFGVRIGAGGEFAVGQLLSFYDFKILDARSCENGSYGDVARAV